MQGPQDRSGNTEHVVGVRLTVNNINNPQTAGLYLPFRKWKRKKPIIGHVHPWMCISEHIQSILLIWLKKEHWLMYFTDTLQRTWLHCFIPLAFIKRLLCAGLCRLMAFRGYCCWRGLWEAELLPATLCPCVRRKQPLQVDPALQICWHQKEVPPRPGRGSSNLGHVVFLSRSEPPLVSLAGHTCAVNNLYKSSRQPCQEVTIQYFCYLARRPTLPWQLVWTANHYLIHPCEAPWSNVQATL